MPRRWNLETMVSLWKPIKVFSSHYASEKFENSTITGHFRSVFEENSGRVITWLSWRHRLTNVFLYFLYLENFRFQIVSRPNENEKPALQEERFREAPLHYFFLDGSRMEIKLRFQILRSLDADLLMELVRV